ncbi:MAG: hypothetical protein MUC65_00750 [Pontiellaceae bacterium]|nr:hypothetical protein [Pontiellaceae bacterium]
MNIQKIAVVGCGLILSVAAGAVAEREDKLSNPFRVSPFVSKGVIYEKSSEEENLFFDYAAGLRLGYTGFELDVNAMGFVSSRLYEGDKDRDFTTGGGSFRLKHGAMERLLVQGDLAFRRVEDIDVYGSEFAVGGVSPDSVLDASTRSRRDVSQAGVSVGRNLTDKMDLETGYRFDDVSYIDPGLWDIATHMVQIETSRKLTDKTDGLLTVKGGMQDHEALDDPAYYYATHLGLRIKSTEKVFSILHK